MTYASCAYLNGVNCVAGSCLALLLKDGRKGIMEVGSKDRLR